MKRNVFRMALCLMLVLMIGAAPMVAFAAKGGVVSILKCNVDGGRLREGPTSAYNVITSLKKGEKVFYNGQKEGAFCFVRTLYGQSGYIYQGFLESYGAARYDQICFAKAPGVRVYKRPADGSSRVTTLGLGEHIIVYKTVGDWAFVKTLRGGSGYVRASALSRI